MMIIIIIFGCDFNRMIRIVVHAKGLLYTPIYIPTLYTYTTHVSLLLLYDIATFARSERAAK